MSKWRPSPLNCLYVIPDIHGCYDQLELICSRILPLRKSDGGKDRLVFLGDYIDRGPNTPGVIEKLIEIKKKYKDQAVFLRGNHEQMLLTALGKIPASLDPFEDSAYSMWIQNGGSNSIEQYAKSVWDKKLDDPYQFPKNRLSDLIPESHVQFMEETEYYHKYEHYIFVHGGCNPAMPLESQDPNALVWDRSMYRVVKDLLASNQELPWGQTVVTGHNYTGPFINEKFMMLDCSGNRKLLVVELNSMEAFEASPNKKRLFKKALKETKVVKKAVVKKPGSFRRVGA